MSARWLTTATRWNRSARSTCSPTPRMSKLCVCFVARSTIGEPASSVAGLHEGFKQRAEFAGPPEVLRMPLHAEHESAARVLERFDHSVGRRRGDGQTFADVLGCLVMTAVHRAGVRILEALAQGPFEQAIGCQPHVVRDRKAWLLDAMLDGRPDFIGNVLNERAAPRHVEYLNPAADRKERQGGPQ